jgi:hypothetical protein
MASIGILSLWVVDQLVYHRLLNSNFLLGLKIEYDHNYIPPIRALMAESSEGRGMSYWLKVFYLVPILGFGVVAVVFVGVSAYSISLESTSFGFFEWVSVCVAAVPIVSGIWIIRRAQDVSFYLSASLFGDEDFTDLVRKGEYRQIIERFRYPKEEEESEASDTS